MTIAQILDACLQSKDESAWVQFVARFQPLIAASIFRVTRRHGYSNPALVDDLIQETYLRLCKDNCRALRSFEARHEDAILAYLKVIATTVALDYFRARSTQKRRDEVESDGALPDVGISSASIEQAALLEQLDQQLAVSETMRDRTIFWLHYLQGYTAKDIADVTSIGLTQKGVESCIYRLTKSLQVAVGRPSGFRTGEPPQNTLGVMK